MPLCSPFLTTAGGLVGSLFLAGLIGGFTHCAGMCGPFVLAQTGTVRKLSSVALVPYHLGRMTTYVTLAVLTSTVLNLAFAASPLKSIIAAPMLAIAGVIFIVTALPRLAVIFPWALNLRIAMPYRWLTAGSKNLLNNPGTVKRFALGVLLGFMPCSLVLSALLAASTADHVGEAGLAMAAFSLGTIPALVMTAVGGNIFKTLFPRFSFYASRSLLVFNGLWLIAMAGFLVG
ncbi:MAG: sulfite exporter TauE/SafE family protein [Alphaproteobacteria bacterium]|nr:sulfite exporter TauE/SafE family protein [Alphaproteobacteria bacterium]